MNIIDKIKSLTRPGDTLNQRVVRGGIWLFTFRGVGEVLRLIRLMVLARLLAPDDFGLMAIATLAMALLESFTESGFGQALIQKKGDLKDYLDTAWTIIGLRGIVLAAILFIAAPYVADFYDEPAAKPIVQAMGGVFLLKGWSNIGRIYFDKELEFHKKFIFEMSATVADLAVAIAAVLILGSVWALVFGYLAGNVTRLIMSYVLHPYRPRLHLDWAKTRELFVFGKWILASSILLYGLNNGTSIVLGKLMTAAALGFYNMASRIAFLPVTELVRVISQVTFPAYSKLQDNQGKLKIAYLKVLKVVAFISIPIAGGIFILADDFTRIFLGEQWLPMVPALQLLALSGLIRSLSTTTGAVFQGIGKPGIISKLQFARLIITAILVYPLISYLGIIGAALTVIISQMATDPVAVYLAVKNTGNGIRDVTKFLSLPLFNAAIMILIIFIFRTYVFDSVGLLAFLFFVILGVVIYIAMTYICDRKLGYGIISLFKEQWRAVKGVSEERKT